LGSLGRKLESLYLWEVVRFKLHVGGGGQAKDEKKFHQNQTEKSIARVVKGKYTNQLTLPGF